MSIKRFKCSEKLLPSSRTQGFMGSRRRSRGTLNAVFLMLAAIVGFAAPASAQLNIELKLNRKTYILHQPIRATVGVTNLASRNIVLGGRGGGDWLTFSVTGTSGEAISPYLSGGFDIEPTVIKPGQKLTRTVTLNRIYDLVKRGNYAVRASVYFPPLQRYITSSGKRFNVDEGRVFWERPVGLPAHEGGGFRRFQLLSYSQSDRTDIFLRLTDEATGTVLTTFALGRAILYRDPSVTTDKNNHLHALFMGAPNTYAHIEVSPWGKVVERTVYRDKGENPPRLMKASDATVGVRGGTLVDPNAPDFTSTDAKGNKIRNLSERPPGWAGRNDSPPTVPLDDEF